jgi:ribosomal protein S18 acetylase RimI-like enzyme
MLIRPALPDDEDAVAAILEPICATGAVFCAPPEGGRTGALAYWGWGMPETRVFLAENDGRALGTYYLRPNQKGNGGHVANAGYATAPAAQGQGVARAMLAHSLDTARAAGFRAMQYNFVVSTNARAIATWEAAGFAVVGRLPGAFRHPREGHVDALVMYRTL